MAYLVKRTVTRPNTSVAFFASTPAFKALVDAAKAAGTLLSSSNTTSNDGLQLVSTALWSNKASYDAFSAQQGVKDFYAARKAHYDSNGTTVVREGTEI